MTVDETPSIGVGMTVITQAEADAVKAFEVLGRAAVGLVLDGLNVSMNLTRFEVDED